MFLLYRSNIRRAVLASVSRRVRSVALSNESGMNDLLSMVRAGFFEEHIETLPETIAKLEKITSGDLLEIANDIYDKDKVNLLVFRGQED